ncbi:MAG: tRNA (adenosine(37)-N6)-threonylcarbamoyltransferase complex ATPase subunit type 1 TsaE [Defluviimonas sp.]|nr:tRNA (adenosine(37)-N6)-threonylcarbamoyltransferase complex ATPase subunit type 1 TsaE [Defluviimonas sp.]
MTARLRLPDAEATAALARRLAPQLRAGDVLLLQGPIGAGKTHFARALIQSLLAAEGRAEDVPSPTFTLVQTYATGTLEIWHADLYRLTSAAEAEDLGLEDAFAEALCLIEWPDRLGSLAPADALTLSFAPEPGGDGRLLTARAGDPRWRAILTALAEAPPAGAPRDAARFIAAAGWGDAARSRLAGDASSRKYDRLIRADGSSAVLMDADPATGEDVAPFLAIGRALQLRGLTAPAVLAEDRAQGFLLLEDLGDDLFARVLARDPALERTLYAAATDVLTHLHGAPLPTGLRAYDAGTMGRMAALAIDWYLPGATGTRADASALAALVGALRDRLAPGDPVMVLRDYHAENLLWLPARSGVARVGLLDFQDAMAGPRAYDLVSMLQDARRDVPEPIEAAMVARYAARNRLDQSRFAAEYALCGAQRNLRILGVFARLSMHYGKPHYVDLIPRVWGLLHRDLAHPALAELQAAVAATLPAPDAAGLQRIKDQCGLHPLR